MTTSPKLVGLNTCLPRARIKNLLAMVITAATTASPTEPARSSRHRDNAEINGLRGSKRGSRHSLVQTHWVISAAARIAAALPRRRSKSSPRTP